MDEKLKEILENLEQVASYRGSIILASEMRATAERLLPYYGKMLFDLILGLHDAPYWPSGHDLENRIRKELGMEPLPLVWKDPPKKSGVEWAKECLEIVRSKTATVERAAEEKERLRRPASSEVDVGSEVLAPVQEKANEALLRSAATAEEFLGGFDDTLDLGGF